MISTIEYLYQDLLAFIAHHFPYISPFWGWLGEGVLVVAICLAIGWAFSSMRPFVGAVIMAVIAGLMGYWRGEHDRERHDERPD
jgi:hypothetical protein